MVGFSSAVPSEFDLGGAEDAWWRKTCGIRVQPEVVGSRVVGSFRARRRVDGIRWAETLANVREWRSIQIPFHTLGTSSQAFERPTSKRRQHRVRPTN